MVISASLQSWGVFFPFAMLTSICRSIVTICSGLYLFIGMTASPPNGFSLIPLGTKTAGHVTVTGRFCTLSSNASSHNTYPFDLSDEFLYGPIEQLILNLVDLSAVFQFIAQMDR